MASRRGAGPTRVVSVNVKGQPARQTSADWGRRDLLTAVVDGIEGLGWRDVDIVLFPAGYFRLKLALGTLDAAERAETLDRSEIGPPCRRAAERLAIGCGAILVVGVDTEPYEPGFSGDQMMVAWTGDGVVATARKVFPSDADTNGERRDPLLLHAEDYEDAARRLRLKCGSGLLAVCYDAFIFAELALGPTAKRGAMRYAWDIDDDWIRLKQSGRQRLLSDFKRKVLTKTPRVLLVGIHGFKRPGREVYWQRHGIATASAALGGALTVGAAHFRKLPDPENPTSGVLGAVGVERGHLDLGLHRKAQRLAPIASATVRVRGQPRLAAVLRLFEA